MFRVLIAATYLTSLILAAPQNGVPRLDGRIVGGEPTFVENIPYQASLRVWNAHSCGAVIISENYLLTAAHCTIGFMATQLELRVGSSYHNVTGSGIMKEVAAIYQHPFFNYSALDYDLSILRVASPLSFGPTIAPVALPEANQPIVPGAIAQISGWGFLHENSIFGDLPQQLQVVEVPLVSSEDCKKAYGADAITDRMICAGLPEGGKDACKGDSGGPVVVNGTVVGLVSWSTGCARPGIPGVHTNVAAFRSYINFVTGL